MQIDNLMGCCAKKTNFAYLTKPMTSFTQRDFFAITKGCEGGSEESSFSA